jgi:hypothetical protein
MLYVASTIQTVWRFIMSDEAKAKAVGMGMAGSAIAAALLDHLEAKGLIDGEEVRGILEDAVYRAATYTGTLEAHEAGLIIGDMLKLREAI